MDATLREKIMGFKRGNLTLFLPMFENIIMLRGSANLDCEPYSIVTQMVSIVNTTMLRQRWMSPAPFRIIFPCAFGYYSIMQQQLDFRQNFPW
jgi:hypothetical protein